MKNLILSLGVLSLILSCNKNEAPSELKTDSEAEISNIQETSTFYSSKGDSLQVTYFALGEEVAVKVKKNSEPEITLEAETISSSGNPVFSNGELNWEMGEGARGGRLLDKQGNGIAYEERK